MLFGSSYQKLHYLDVLLVSLKLLEMHKAKKCLIYEKDPFLKLLYMLVGIRPDTQDGRQPDGEEECFVKY